MREFKNGFATALLVLLPALGQAALELSPLFSEGAVLQQGMRLPVWGWGDPGAAVTVRFAGQAVSGTVDAEGRWMLHLAPLTALKQPEVMTVNDEACALSISNVVVGEVWVCSGQSNMDYTLSRLQTTRNPAMQTVADHNRETIETAADPFLRQIGIPKRTVVEQPLKTFEPNPTRREGVWLTADPPNAQLFSAVGFYYAKALREALDVPVGLIKCAWGGRIVEPFIPLEKWRSEPGLSAFYESTKPLYEEYRKYLADRENLDRQWAEWTREAAAARNEGRPEPSKPAIARGLADRLPGAIYHGMIAPLAPYGIRGVIWYQGESNCRAYTDRYGKHFPALIESWREQWGQGLFPFYFCQLAGFGGWEEAADEPVEDSSWATISNAQRLALRVPNTGMAVLKDVGDRRDIHPTNKHDAGKRLALWALARTYGRDIAVYSGPLYKDHVIKGGDVFIRFDHAGSGLMAGEKPPLGTAEASNAPLSGFQICGADRQWKWARADIVGRDTVKVYHPEVAEPVEVRYGWKGYSERFNLYNREGLPASVFRTDRRE
jgi:sialate O-acetylesterase